MSAPYYTPQRPYFPPSNHPSASSSTSTTRAGGSGSGASGATGAPSFTPAMRDRQARGKDPYSPHDSPSDSDLEFEGGGAGGSPSRGGSGVGRLGHLGPGAGHHGGGGGMLAGGGGGGVGDGDSHEVRRRKLWAVAVLEDPEKLAMYACSRGDVSRIPPISLPPFPFHPSPTPFFLTLHVCEKALSPLLSYHPPPFKLSSPPLVTNTHRRANLTHFRRASPAPASTSPACSAVSTRSRCISSRRTTARRRRRRLRHGGTRDGRALEGTE